MAKILFISDNFLDEGLGIMSLSSYMKANGHDVELMLMSEYRETKDILKFIQDAKPDLVGFSVMTPQVNTFRSLAKTIKESIQCRVIWGGPHCTFMPENVAEGGYADIICIGEGEEVLLTLMNRIDEESDYTDIPGLWAKRNQEWIKNEVGYLEDNLDKYPALDRGLYYDRYPFLGSFSLKRFMTQRGCPYDCFYCFEPVFRDLYKGKGKFIRRHSAGYMINEIKETISKYPTGTVHFSDDTFNLNREWVMEFLPRYKKEIGLPFTCNICVSGVDSDMVAALKDAGCNGVVFGLESGAEHLRTGVLNKKITDAKYTEVSRLLHNHKIKFAVNMMLCLPTETLDDAIKGVRFARSLRPYTAKIGILKLYKGTKLADFAVKNNLCEATGEFTYKAKDANNEHKSVRNVFWAGLLMIKLPFLARFAKLILTCPVFKIFKPLSLWQYYLDKRFFKVPAWQSLMYFWNSRKVFIEGLGRDQSDIYKNCEAMNK